MNKYNDYAKGRADRAAEKYQPPPHGFFGTGLFDSQKEFRETAERRQTYREGYHDKDCEIRKP
jgi:hypothetical protein